MNTYLVGGAVRDRLLGATNTEKDRDWVVVGSTPDEMLKMGFIQVGKDFPVFLHPKTKEEYALARTERKIKLGYAGFDFNAKNVSLEDDLRRRDLTINAIAEEKNGRLIDPYGGQIDLKYRYLNAVSEAFAEDPVRILRIARLSAQLGRWDFKVTHKTHEMLKKMVQNGEVDSLVSERVWQETEKALNTNHPQKFIKVLRNCGALQKIFPEIDQLFGVPQVAKYHPEIDTGVHTLMVLTQAVKLSPKPEVRFAALLHDLGKGNTKKEILPSHHGHELRSVKLVKELCKRLKVPKKYRDLALLVAEFHGYFYKVADELKPRTIVKLLNQLNAFKNPERFQDFLLACEADQRGRTGFENKKFIERTIFNQCFEIANKITAKPFLQKGFSGENIKNAIHQSRVKLVEKFITKIRKDAIMGLAD